MAPEYIFPGPAPGRLLWHTHGLMCVMPVLQGRAGKIAWQKKWRESKWTEGKCCLAGDAAETDHTVDVSETIFIVWKGERGGCNYGQSIAFNLCERFYYVKPLKISPPKGSARRWDSRFTGNWMRRRRNVLLQVFQESLMATRWAENRKEILREPASQAPSQVVGVNNSEHK